MERSGGKWQRFILQISTQTIEVAVLFGVAIGLMAAYVVVPSDSAFVFTYGDPSVLTMWTAAAQHDSASHLLSNVTTYVLVVGITYPIYMAQKRRTEFWVIVASCLLITPPVTTAGDYWLLAVQWSIVAPTATAQGFSGVVSAFVGVLFVSLVESTVAVVSHDSLTNQPQWPLIGMGWVVAVILIATLLQTGVTDGRFVNGLVHLIGLVTGSLTATAVLLCSR